MSLLETRKNFIVFSGRYDLVTDYEGGNYSDNGANFFLQAGQKWLDRASTHTKSYARRYENLLSGAWYALIPYVRAIQQVWMSKNSGEKWKLEKKSLERLRARFAKDPVLLQHGDPLFYAPVSLRTIIEIATLTTLDIFGSTQYSTNADHYRYNGLLFLPPASEELVLEVHGLFYQPVLSEDDHANYWSEEHEFLLIMAGCRALEISYRNAQGVADWEKAIMTELMTLEFDEVEEESAEVAQMEG